MPNAEDEEAVRIFVEFERMESAIKGETLKKDKLMCLQLHSNGKKNVLHLI